MERLNKIGGAKAAFFGCEKEFVSMNPLHAGSPRRGFANPPMRCRRRGLAEISPRTTLV